MEGAGDTPAGAGSARAPLARPKNCANFFVFACLPYRLLHRPMAPCRTNELSTGVRTECPTTAGFVRAPAYGVCPDAEKSKARRFLDSTALQITGFV